MSDEECEVYAYEDDEDGGYEEASYPDAFRVPDGSYNILDYKDMTALMDAMSQEAETVLGVSRDTALILLSHYGWNKEKLLDTYWSDPEACLRCAGLSPSSCRPAEGGASTVTCSICYDQVPPAETTHLSCGHMFCRGCYTQYLSIKVDNEGAASVQTHCPEPKCSERVPESLFKDLLGAASVAKYREFAIKSFIESSRFIRYCPAAGCDKVAIGRGITNVVCHCANPFCFRCGEETHDPATCDQLSRWLDKCRNESETANWMIVNTKKCPKCDARTEKNQGCNHMTCRLCKHDYCWICMSPWREHGQGTGGYYSCNKFVDPAAASGGSGDAKDAAVELERYLHYYTRYQGHDSSMKHAQRVQLCAVDVRLKAVEDSDGDGAWVDVHFLRDAVLQVIECRRVLKYTYVLGYFLGSNAAHKELFEHHQAMLEKNTDLLSEYTEMTDVDKPNVINFTGITRQFMTNLLSAMMDSSFSSGL
ncbi:unnamed protein product, partial [Ectocarpus fasciculatus]